MRTAAELPPIASLPPTDTVLTTAARDIALLGGGVLDLSRSALMLLRSSRQAPPYGAAMTLWDRGLHVSTAARAQLRTDPDVKPVLFALGVAMEAAFDRLCMWGWSGVVDGRLHAITDGTGLALLTDPGASAAIDRDWLFRIAARNDGCAPILAFADHGVWSLLRDHRRRTIH